MVRALSRKASDDGPLADAAPERGPKAARPAPPRSERSGRLGARRGISSGPNHAPRKKSVSEMLRLLHRVALAIVTLVCAGVASPGLGLAALTAPAAIEVAAADAAIAARPLSAPEPVRQCEDADEEAAVDLKAVESDADGDALCRLPESADLAFEAVPFPREPDQAPRSEQQVDTSRFAMGTGFPRGPPV